jgi:ferritin
VRLKRFSGENGGRVRIRNIDAVMNSIKSPRETFVGMGRTETPGILAAAR